MDQPRTTTTRALADFDDIDTFIDNGLISANPPSDEDFCPICYDDWDPDANDVVQTMCNHVFHKACISKWLQKWEFGEWFSTCPTDRQKLCLSDWFSTWIGEFEWVEEESSTIVAEAWPMFDRPEPVCTPNHYFFILCSR